jgi:hypothetical protein
LTSWPSWPTSERRFILTATFVGVLGLLWLADEIADSYSAL